MSTVRSVGHSAWDRSLVFCWRVGISSTWTASWKFWRLGGSRPESYSSFRTALRVRVSRLMHPTVLKLTLWLSKLQNSRRMWRRRRFRELNTKGWIKILACWILLMISTIICRSGPCSSLLTTSASSVRNLTLEVRKIALALSKRNKLTSLRN